MADEGYFNSMVNALFGRKAEAAVPPVNYEPAPKLERYPTHDDAAEARKYGFGYTQGYEPYVQGDVARVMGRNFPVTMPLSVAENPNSKIKNRLALSGADGMSLDQATSLDESQTKNLDFNTEKDDSASVARDRLGDNFARAALTANRIPIAGLGYDPRRMVVDTMTDRANIAGIFNPKTDSIYFNMIRHDKDPSTPVHEALHRGLGQLRKLPEAEHLFRRLPSSEETIVRYLMATQAGDPELAAGDGGLAQRKFALDLMGKGHWDKELTELNALAAKEVAKRKPGGPN